MSHSEEIKSALYEADNAFSGDETGIVASLRTAVHALKGISRVFPTANELAERADFFKHKKEGVNTMCKIMQTLHDEGRAEGIATGRNEMATDTAMKMLRFNEPIEKIVTYTNLSPERIAELAQQIR
jgi:phosphoglycolate phosphatase-like HAD superfamily hydrolase